MDDPDVDHDLIAFMRESLGISSKAQDIVTSDTGKAGLFFFFSRVSQSITWTASPLLSLPGYPCSSSSITTLLLRY
jgi:hypothetical protein